MNKNLLVLLGLSLLIAGGAWYGLSGSNSDSSLLETNVVAGGQSDIVATLLALRSVSLSSSIFSDPAFTVLRDFGTQILPEPVGRSNPFAPLSSGSGTTTQESENARAFGPTR